MPQKGRKLFSIDGLPQEQPRCQGMAIPQGEAEGWEFSAFPIQSAAAMPGSPGFAWIPFRAPWNTTEIGKGPPVSAGGPFYKGKRGDKGFIV